MKNKHFKNNKGFPRTKCISCPIELESYIPQEKTEMLICHKSSLEILLSEVKNSQILLLSYRGKFLKKNIKSILSDLNNNLSFILKEKNAKMKIIEKEKDDKKATLQNQIFNESKTEQTKDIRNKNIYDLNNEISLLKGLNFSIEYSLEKIENIIIKKSNELNYFKLCMNYTYLDEKETICIEQKYYPIVTKILHKGLNNARKKFKKVVSAKQYQNDEIENTTQNISQYKKLMSQKNNGYMNNKEIIPEESKDYTQSLSYNRNSNIINNNTLANIMNIYDNISQNNENEDNKKKNNNESEHIIYLDDLDSDKESDFSKNGPDSPKIQKNKDAKINNNIQNLINLNMNINLNVNFDKFVGQDNNINYNTERNNYDFNLLNNDKGKKGLSSTGSLPYLIINSFKDEIKDNPIDQNKNKENDVDNICKDKKKSKNMLNDNYLITY